MFGARFRRRRRLELVRESASQSGRAKLYPEAKAEGLLRPISASGTVLQDLFHYRWRRKSK
jgi:hypothetical protein